MSCVGYTFLRHGFARACVCMQKDPMQISFFPWVIRVGVRDGMWKLGMASWISWMVSLGEFSGMGQRGVCVCVCARGGNRGKGGFRGWWIWVKSSSIKCNILSTGSRPDCGATASRGRREKCTRATPKPPQNHPLDFPWYQPTPWTPPLAVALVCEYSLDRLGGLLRDIVKCIIKKFMWFIYKGIRVSSCLCYVC